MEKLKERHGCVSIWLWIVIVVNLCFCVYYFITMLDSESSQSLGYGFLSALSVSLILGAILLMRWSRCGFYLMIGTSLLTLIVNHFLLEIEVGYRIHGILGILFWCVYCTHMGIKMLLEGISSVSLSERRCIQS